MVSWYNWRWCGVFLCIGGLFASTCHMVANSSTRYGQEGAADLARALRESNAPPKHNKQRAQQGGASLNTWSVTPDWNTLNDGDTSILNIPAVNAINGESHAHLPSFNEFSPYRGEILAKRGLLVDFMGFVIPQTMYCNKAYMWQKLGHAIRTRQCSIYESLRAKVATLPDGQTPILQTQWPVISEEYFEYADVLQAVSGYVTRNEDKKRPFTFLEFGAGYGHWTFTAHRALMQKAPHASYRYLMVDVVAELAETAKNLSSLNGMTWTDGSDSPVHFHLGMIGASGQKKKDSQNAKSWRKNYLDMWGLTTDKKFANKEIPPISFRDLLDVYNMPCEIDMVDVDIQAAEYDLFADDDTVSILTDRVHYLHIGLHTFLKASGPDRERVDRAIESKFKARGWTTRLLFSSYCCEGKMKIPSSKTKKKIGFSDTALGPVSFNDGVLSLENPNPIRCPQR